MGRLEFALKEAVRAHEGRKDRAGKPEILHPIHVMMQMETEDEQVLALLHDTVENAPVKARKGLLTYLTSSFGQEIGDALDAITQRDQESYEDYIRRVVQNRLARKVKRADMEHNMSPRRMLHLKPEVRAKLLKKYSPEVMSILYGG